MHLHTCTAPVRLHTCTPVHTCIRNYNCTCTFFNLSTCAPILCAPARLHVHFIPAPARPRQAALARERSRARLATSWEVVHAREEERMRDAIAEGRVATKVCVWRSVSV